LKCVKYRSIRVKDEDTTGVIGSRNSKKKNSQYIGQKKNDEDTTGVIGSRNSPSFSHSRLFTGCVPRVTRRVPHVEQEQITLPEYLILPSVSCGVRVA
jgi:hypothetical protein